MMSYTEPVVLNHGELWWARGCKSWCVMLSQWFCMIASYSEPMVVNHVVICSAGLIWIMVSYAESVGMKQVCYTELVVVGHGVLCWASGCESLYVILFQSVVVNHIEWSWACGCESWFVKLSQWLWYHVVLCWTSGCESLCVILSEWLWIMLCYAEPVVVNDDELC